MAIQSAAIIQGGPTSSRQQVVPFIMRSLSKTNVSCVYQLWCCIAPVGGEIWEFLSHAHNCGTSTSLQMKTRRVSKILKWWRALGSLATRTNSSQRFPYLCWVMMMNLKCWKEIEVWLNHMCSGTACVSICVFVCVCVLLCLCNCVCLWACLQRWWLNGTKTREKSLNYFPQARNWVSWYCCHRDINLYLDKQVTTNMSGKC